MRVSIGAIERLTTVYKVIEHKRLARATSVQMVLDPDCPKALRKKGIK